MAGKSPIAVDQAAKAAEHGAFAGLASAGAGSGGDDAIGQTREGQGLQPHLTRAPEGGEKQTFPAEEGGLDAAHERDVVIDAGLESDDAPGVDPQAFARLQRALVEGAASMEEGPAIAFEALHDETFTTEGSGANFFIKSDPDAHAFGGTKERVLLRKQSTAHVR